MPSQGARSTSSVKPRTTTAYEHSARGETSAAKTKGGRTAQARRRSGSVTLTRTWDDGPTGFLTNVGKSTFGSGSKTPATPAPSASGPTMKAPTKDNFLTRKVSWGGSQLQRPTSAPSVTVGSAPATFAHFNKGTSARLIILAMGIAGVSIIFGGRNFQPYESKVNGKTVKVPGTLHAFAGLTIAGTIALIVNEVSPDVGIVFAVGLGFIALTDAKAFAAWGTKVFGGGTRSVSKSPFPSNPSYDPNPNYRMPPPQAALPGSSPGGYGNLSG